MQSEASVQVTPTVVSKDSKQNDSLVTGKVLNKMSLSVRQNFHDSCEQAVNEQINLELYASYMYLALAFQFDRCDVALKGFHQYFKEQSKEERGHAELFMSYINKRGGTIVLKDIKAPLKYDFKTGSEAMKAALQLERDVNESLLKLHTLASDKKDPHLCSFVEENFLGEQVESIKKIADFITNLERAGNDYHFDKLTLSD